jgi:hypothetical protein
MPVFDDKDAEILKARIAEWDKRTGPRVGDFVHMLDGTLRRFTHDHGDGLQTTCGKAELACDVSFYFGKGYMDFSGSLDPQVARTALVDTGETMIGRAWFFHHDHVCAHSGVYMDVPCRVFRQTEVAGKL